MIALGTVALAVFIANKIVNGTEERLTVEIPMIVENHSMEDDYIPENAIIRFELEEMEEASGIADIKDELLYRVTTFENFSTGALTFNFGGFDFSRAGIYKYRVTQVLHEDMTEQKNWELDLVSFYITITVTKIDGELSPFVTILRANDSEWTEVPEVRFVNTYLSK